jgi:hypothetical protein
MEGMRHMWMRFEPCSPEAYSMYVGGHRAKRSPQRARSLHATVRHLEPPLLFLTHQHPFLGTASQSRAEDRRRPIIR